jgi:uncharacterized protein YfdQ (DUF2303 family)
MNPKQSNNNEPAAPAATEAEAIAKLVKNGREMHVFEAARGGVEKADFAAVPEGIKLESLKRFTDEYLRHPERKRGTAQLKELGSFIDHVNRHKDGSSVIFADPHPERPKLLAVYDYNHPGTGEPRWGEHRAKYGFPLSDEWKAWRAADNQEMPQKKFAAFLEDRIVDLLDPSTATKAAKELAQQIGCAFGTPGKVLEVSRGLSVVVEAKLADHHTLSSGETQVTYHESHSDTTGKPISVPGAILLGIPVFKGGDRFEIGARLRYRAPASGLVWWFTLYRTDRIFDFAFKEALKKVAEATSLPVLIGKPEVPDQSADD